MNVGVDGIMVQGREAGGHVIGQVLMLFSSTGTCFSFIKCFRPCTMTLSSLYIRELMVPVNYYYL